MQDEINEKVVALSVKGAKLTAETLQKAIKAMLAQAKKQQEKQPHGKQTLKQLAKQNAGLSNIEITEGNIKAFEQTAKKYGIDFALKKDSTETPPRYLVFFKGRLMQASHDVTVKQSQLQQAQEDNVALGVAYEKAFDQSAVKAAAQAAGMTKPTTDQIEYIELGGADMAEICRPESTGPLAQAWNWVKNGVDAVVEYFR